jgi:hypothetical protein
MVQDNDDQIVGETVRQDSRQRTHRRFSGSRGKHQKTSKSRKRKGSRSKGSKRRFGSIYKDTESDSQEDDDVSEQFP